jgi:hypothetical protein
MDYLGDFRNKDGIGNVVAEGLIDHLKKLAGVYVRNCYNPVRCRCLGEAGHIDRVWIICDRHVSG